MRQALKQEAPDNPQMHFVRRGARGHHRALMQETPFLDQPAQRAVRFSDAERQLLLLTPGVGPMVLERMEDVGITSVEQLRREGVEAVVDLVCRRVGSTAWANRKVPWAVPCSAP